MRGAESMPRLAAHKPCPCDSGQAYGNCCARWHVGITHDLHAPTPETLMRSRYSAYALQLNDYLLATWHPSSAPGELDLAPLKWLGLEVRQTECAGDVGVVEFVARYRSDGHGHRLHEISRFTREDGRWYYIDGQIVEPD